MVRGWLAALTVLMIVAGCSGDDGANSGPVEPAHDHAHAHDHGHHDAGPHGGHVLALGDEQYHAEWTHDDDAGRLTVYLLDAQMKEEIPISAESIELHVTIAGDTSEYALAAVRDEGATESARFERVDKGLIEALKLAGQGSAEEGVHAVLRVEIDGQAYEGVFEHHDHDHGHHH